MKKHTSLFIFLLLLFSCSTNKEIYVSVEGNDSNNGTKESPVASLSYANKKAVELASESPVTIILLDGTHYISETIQHSSNQYKGNNYPIKYTSQNEGKATISTSAILKNLEWKKHTDKIVKATIEGDILIKELFVDGEKQHIARYPNYNKDIRHFNGYAEDAISTQRSKNWKNPQGAIAHIMHRGEWGGYHYKVKGKDEKGELILDGGFQNNRQLGMHTKYRMIENIFEELDAENEWYYNSDSKTLYFYPAANLDLNTALIETPQLSTIFDIRGSKENPIKNITIEQLTLTQTLPTYMQTDEMLLRSDWAIHRGAAVMFEYAQNCMITECTLTDIGGNAIFFSNYNRENTASKNHIYNIGASAICFVGSPHAVRSPSFNYSDFVSYKEMDLEKGPKTNNYPSLCYADNNLIHDIGKIEKQVAGVQISMASSITVSHNSIYNVPRAGINVSEGTWGGHTIEGNDVFNTVLETGDHGSFNSWGRDRFWHPRRAHLDTLLNKHPELIELDAIETTIIRNNRWQCFHGWDIDLDDGSSNYHIYNNLCLNGGLKLREGFNRTVENNIMINNSFHPHVWFENSKDVFKHNIVTQSYKPIWMKHWGKEIDYNLFPDSLTLKNALDLNTDAHSAYGNPLFLDADKGDYRVAENSPASKIGFKNFDMDKFGVQYQPLKRKAETPILPKFIALMDENNNQQTYEWLGAIVKTMTTEGERSASGMHTTTGIIVLKLSEKSPLKRAGAHENDVIVDLNNSPVCDWEALNTKFQSIKGAKQASLTVFRNQTERKIELAL